ncbi:uncharacterized protein V6R79_000363 [Siganus canaliculatus]
MHTFSDTNVVRALERVRASPSRAVKSARCQSAVTVVPAPSGMFDRFTAVTGSVTSSDGDRKHRHSAVTIKPSSTDTERLPLCLSARHRSFMLLLFLPVKSIFLVLYQEQEVMATKLHFNKQNRAFNPKHDCS